LSNITSGLVGIPFADGGRNLAKGVDCWGLFMAGMARFGVIVPDFQIPCDATGDISEAFGKEIGKWERVILPRPGDAVVMVIDPYKPKDVQHFGVYIGHGKFLHTMRKTGSVISKVDDPMWRRRIRGFYRWSR